MASSHLLLLLYLIIGHLVGDFLLQPSKLVRYKNQSIYGIFLHCWIILLSQTFLLLPYLISFKTSLALILITFFHFWIDYFKIKIQYFKKQEPIFPFILDQLLHFSVIGWVFPLLKDVQPVLFQASWWFESLYQNQALLIYFAGVVFFSYTYDIILLTIKLKHNPHYQYHRGYFEMLLRVTGFALIYVIYSTIVA